MWERIGRWLSDTGARLGHVRRSVLVAGVAAVGVVALVVGPALAVVAGYELFRRPPEPDPSQAVGTEVRDGPAVFVVHEIRCGPDEKRTAHGRRCEVLVSVRNEGAEKLPVPLNLQMLHGPEGVRHLPAKVHAPRWTLAPGEQTTAVLDYDLPLHAPVTHVGVRATPHSAGQEVAIGERPLPLPDD